MTMSLSEHLNRGSDVGKRGDLCNPPQKSNPAKNNWGHEHLRAAKAAHLPCQVYEGKGKEKESENDQVQIENFQTVSGHAPSFGRVPTMV